LVGDIFIGIEGADSVVAIGGVGEGADGGAGAGAERVEMEEVGLVMATAGLSFSFVSFSF
jgi:hypothetical protein